jgi:dTDP-4-dehydrorhamnose reductase
VSVRVLVLGASGMLGRAVLRVARSRPGWLAEGSQNGDPAAPGYFELARGYGVWSAWLRARPCDYVVNCIGMLKAAADANVREAIRINALFPHELAEIAAEQGARVVHMSTDGVFSGASGRPYFEDDPADCPDPYGKTKALGECVAPHVVNVRCSIIGRNPAARKGLLEWVLGQPEGAGIPGFEDQAWNGVTTIQFARMCAALIASGDFDRVKAVSPVHHFCPNPAVSKYELLRMAAEASGKRITVRPALSGAPGSRVLATRYGELRRFYPDCPGWAPVLREAITDFEGEQWKRRNWRSFWAFARMLSARP